MARSQAEIVIALNKAISEVRSAKDGLLRAAKEINGVVALESEWVRIGLLTGSLEAVETRISHKLNTGQFVLNGEGALVNGRLLN